MMRVNTRAAAAAVGMLSVVLSGQTPSGPTTDRVGFPAGYDSTFTKMMTMDRTDFNRMTVVYANDKAASANWWDPMPYGSVLVQEQWSSKRDAAGNVALDENGRTIKDVVQLVLVKRKEVGFGEAYQGLRTGEWEYVSYRPDGTVATTPQNSGTACAACHIQAGPNKDWTFRRQQWNNPTGGVVPAVTMSHYQFYPRTVTVQKGALLSIRNDDEVQHTVLATASGAFSGLMNLNDGYQLKFDEEGEYDVLCTIHTGMRIKVTVKK